jgi:hypothetical protein
MTHHVLAVQLDASLLLVFDQAHSRLTIIPTAAATVPAPPVTITYARLTALLRASAPQAPEGKDVTP